MNSASSNVRGLPAQTLHRAGENTQVQKMAQEHLAGWQRARADYENLHREMERRLLRASEKGKESLLVELFPVIDYFDAAAAHLPEKLRDHPWAQGMLQVHQAFRQFLTDAGVIAIGETGMMVDPTLHEVVEKETSVQPAGVVTTVVAHGYMRADRVLRPAKVRVSSGEGTRG